MSTTVLNYSPGQLVSLFFETFDSSGLRADGYVPVVQQIIFPNLSIANGFPQPMIRLMTGFYRYQFLLPSGGASAIGSYIVDISYHDGNDMPKQTFIQVVCSSPGGRYSATVG